MTTIRRWEYITDLLSNSISKDNDLEDYVCLMNFLPSHINDSHDDFKWTFNDFVRMLHHTCENDTHDVFNCNIYNMVSKYLTRVLNDQASHSGAYGLHVNFEQQITPFVIEYIHSSTKCSLSEAKDSLPSVAGVYSIWAKKIEDMCDYKLYFEYPLYVGQTINLQSRFKSHHRMVEFTFLERCGLELNFYYVEETPFRPIRNTLDALEAKLIECLQPILNNQLVTQFQNIETVKDLISV